MHRDHSETGPDAVDTHIPDRGPASCYEGLVVFVPGGKDDADEEGGRKQLTAPQAAIKAGQGHGEGQEEVFGHVGQLADGELNFPGAGVKLIVRHVISQQVIANLYDFIADLIA